MGVVEAGVPSTLLALILFAFLLAFGVLLLFLTAVFDSVFFKSRTLSEIDRMSGFTFEKFLSVLFRSQGYQVTMTADTGDFGADLLLKKDGVSTAVQAKRWRKLVGVHAVQEVLAARAYYHCQRAMVVTNSRFSPAAWTLAKRTGVWLVDRRQLREWVKSKG